MECKQASELQIGPPGGERRRGMGKITTSALVSKIALASAACCLLLITEVLNLGE